MRHVLVFQLARFGDIVQTKRLLLTLAGEADTQVHLCVDASLSTLAALLYPFATIHAVPAHGLTALPSAELLAKTHHTFQELRRVDFAAVYLMNFSPLSFACSSLFPPERVHGYARVNGQDMRGRWTKLSFNLMHDRRFAPINLVDMWANVHPNPVPPEAVNRIPRPCGSNRIGIVMAGRESRRSLPPPILANCVQAIFQARGGPALVCIGSKAERPLVRQLARSLSSQAAQKIEDTTGTTSLTDLPDLMRGLDMVITPDTGAMHLAAHLGVPVQAFFLSSAWCFETGPYGFGHKIWQAVEPCSPCRETVPCPRAHICLAPFSHKGFLAHLAGKFDGSWPEGLLGCISTLDTLGTTYRCVDGEDPYATARHELRTGLKEYLQIPLYSSTKTDSATRSNPLSAEIGHVSPGIGDFLYAEADWMLPGNWRGA